MQQLRMMSPVAVAVLVAIGCGGSKPQSASATQGAQDETASSVQLAQATGQPSPDTSPPGASTQPAGSGGASIVGTVRLVGPPPAPQPIGMDADPVCQQQHATPAMSEAVVVNPAGMLQNVFVYVQEGVQGSFPPPAAPVVVDQAGCGYHPHVSGIQVNQPLELVNSDSTLHNVNAKPANNPPFNVAQPVKGMKTTKKFTKPEVMVSFKCNVHPWMQGYLGVVDHPFFAVSREDGSFAIPHVPAGTYVLEAWHERYGTQRQTVSVGEGETKTVEWSFKAQ